MVRFIIIASLLLFTTLSTVGQKYAVKSGHVEYKLSGSTNGTKLVWWDDYGTKIRTEINAVTQTKMFGTVTEQKKHTITITVEDQNWTADMINHTGIKSVNPYYTEARELSESLTEAQKTQLKQQVMDAFNAEKLGTEKVLGKTCEILSVMGGKSWIYNGVVLKSEVNVLGITNYETATLFKENITIPDAKFLPVKGFNYEDLQAAQQEYYGNIYGDESSEEEETEDPVYPVKYSFEKFRDIVNNFAFQDYSQAMCQTIDGNHMAIFTKALVNSITIVAASNKEYTDKDKAGFESFKHQGRNCWFGNLDGDEGTAIFVEYPEHEMFILIAGTPYLSKTQLLEIQDKLKF